MDRVGVFVDASYLLGAGAAAVTGERKRRSEMRVKPEAVKVLLESWAEEKCQLPLLRIYWYDGALEIPTPVQSELALCEEIKLQLRPRDGEGPVEFLGADLVKLAENRAIASAVVVAGTEYLVAPVRRAQMFGVRVHLLGVEAGPESLSRSLRQEVDTVSRLSTTDIQRFLAPIEALPESYPVEPSDSLPVAIQRASAATADALPPVLLATLGERFRRGEPRLPADVDRHLMATLGRALEGELDEDGRRGARERFRALVLERLQRDETEGKS